jgi:hypothetical protein
VRRSTYRGLITSQLLDNKIIVINDLNAAIWIIDLETRSAINKNPEIRKPSDLMLRLANPAGNLHTANRNIIQTTPRFAWSYSTEEFIIYEWISDKNMRLVIHYDYLSGTEEVVFEIPMSHQVLYYWDNRLYILDKTTGNGGKIYTHSL